MWVAAGQVVLTSFTCLEIIRRADRFDSKSTCKRGGGEEKGKSKPLKKKFCNVKRSKLREEKPQKLCNSCSRKRKQEAEMDLE